MCYVLGTYEKENIPYRSIVRAEWSGADSLQPEFGYSSSSGEHQCPGYSALDKQIRHPVRVTLATVSKQAGQAFRPASFMYWKGKVRHPCIRGMIDLSFCARFSLGLFGKPIKVSS
jgi:hypothetical protein